MLKAIKEFFMGKTKEEPVNPQITDAVTQAPYKVPEPAVTTPIPLVVETAPVADKPKKTSAPKKTAAPKKTPTPKKTAPKKAAK